eukprot:TRINITY_DN5094_c0_g1_i1.p1 TRINITY_DN5094_c0_g1~~TRINITY_DN5094_c0_g1_i1.p1  ORF type:complete len:939 (+),score=203.70 TRINITY_DN5094_c0_g1_i1:58-2817(+)
MSEAGDPAALQDRQIEYSFQDQFAAVFKKSLTNQFRQYKTNVCQISFPVLLLLALFLLQLLVTSIFQSTAGVYTEAVNRPSLTPGNLYIPQTGLSCQSANLEVDYKNGKFLVAEGNNRAQLGRFGGLSLSDPENAALLPSTFVEPNGVNASGFLGNISMGLTNFVAYKSEISVSRGGNVFPTICFGEPKFLYPLINYTSSKADIDNTVFNDWRKVVWVGGYDLSSINVDLNNFVFSVFYNRTLSAGRDLPLIVNIITNAIWKTAVKNLPDSKMILAGTKDFPRPRTLNDFDLISVVGPSLYIYLFHLLFPVVLQNLVFEKEFKLREIMKMMGLKTWIYWLVTYIFSYMLYLIAAGLSIAIAVAMNFRYYRVNNFLSYFLLFFFWGHVMVATAFFLSVFFTKTRTATVVGYTYILFVGLFGPNLIAQYFNSDDTPSSTIFLLSMFPPFAFYRGLLALGRGVAFGGAGITVGDIASSDYQLDSVYYFLIVEWAILMVLAVYFENVLPIGPGVKEHPLFFLPKRWHWWQKAPKELMDAGKDDGKDPDDVVAERKRTLAVAGTEKAPAITIVGLNKVFPARDGMPPKVAVRALTMGISYGECLGFLGPNGAGKSTTINMLCGYLRPTSGRATINGLDILQEVDEVHLQMGVCPQEDVLWDDLTGPEHLRFYGRLKNLRGKQLEDQVDYWLRQVNLHNDKTKFSRQYSGGMKRRLSVALALIGNPRVVLLDEPTTGLDPGSRRALWDVITNYKRHCAMMLTTHSMEEAEGLCDRLSIFVAGRLKTIGASAELKDRYGKYYKIQVTTDIEHEQQARKHLEKIAPGVELINTLAGTATYEVSRDAVKLHEVFRSLESNKQDLHIRDWGISNTTLEEVFLKITQKGAEDEAAAVVGRKGGKGCFGKKKSRNATNTTESDSDVELDEV